MVGVAIIYIYILRPDLIIQKRLQKAQEKKINLRHFYLDVRNPHCYIRLIEGNVFSVLLALC